MSKKLIFLTSFVLVLALVSNAPSALPSEWRSQDVGDAMGTGGSASESGGTWTVNGDGHDIWDNSDGFHYVYKFLEGGGEIVAQVLSIENTDPWAKAGVMIRNTLDGDSANAMAYITSSGRVGWQYRAVAAANTVSTRSDESTIKPPHWVKLSRQGNIITAQHSSDGVTWEDMVETANPHEPSFKNILMNQNFYIGLALTSHSSGIMCKATFDNVSCIGEIYWPKTAFVPIPSDGAIHPGTWVTLTWSPGQAAASHDVYFGENFDDVYEGTGETFQGNKTKTSFTVGLAGFPYPDGLVPGKTYYWRVDEVEADGTTIHKGQVWRFALPLPGIAYAPYPADGARFTNPDITLSWTGGFAAVLHHVYIGENFNDVNDGTGGTYKGPLADPTYTPGTLEFDKVYYWRIDEFDGSATHKGDVWSFKTAPVGNGLRGPEGVGYKIANNIISRDLGNHYASACSFYGVCIFSEATNDPQLLDAVRDKYQPYVTGEKKPRGPGHVDWNVFGILPFELYRQTGNYDDYVPLAKSFADTEFENPRPDGLSPYTRFWVDDLYMVGSLQAQAYKNLQDPKYIDNGVIQLLGYIEEVEDLQRPNGLFHHAFDSPFFWGRGCGWAAAAMTEILSAMPFDHPKRGQLMAAYQRMMDGLLQYQDQSGMWYQLVDRTDHPDNWFETSSTGMFVFALATGVQHGWLVGDHYKNAAIRGWDALEGYVNENGQVREVCIGTGKGYSVQHYLDRPRRLGDFHGQAGVMWAATAMVRSGLTTYTIENVEDFETGDFSRISWEHGGDENWSVTSQQKHSGAYSAKAGSIEDDQSTALQVTLDCVSGNITFYRKVSSESDFDYLQFSIDGVKKSRWSGEEDWAEVSFPVTAGTRTFEWTYSKDGSVSEGDDTAWIDDIVFPVESETE